MKLPTILAILNCPYHRATIEKLLTEATIRGEVLEEYFLPAFNKLNLKK